MLGNPTCPGWLYWFGMRKTFGGSAQEAVSALGFLAQCRKVISAAWHGMRGHMLGMRGSGFKSQNGLLASEMLDTVLNFCALEFLQLRAGP